MVPSGGFFFVGGEFPALGGGIEAAPFVDYGPKSGLTIGVFSCYTSKGAVKNGGGSESGFNWPPGGGWWPTPYANAIVVDDISLPVTARSNIGLGYIKNLSTGVGSTYMYGELGKPGGGFFGGFGVDDCIAPK